MHLSNNYFLSYFLVHIFKNVGYRKLANISKSMKFASQLCQKIKKMPFHFFGKMS